MIKLEQLIKRCKDKDRISQREMVNFLAPFLFGTCRRYSDRTEDAKDLLQEALIKIFNNIDQCKNNEFAFKSWCKKITINIALEKYRKKGLGKRVSLEHIVPRTTEPIDTHLNVEDILQLLHQLPEKLRIVFNLYIIDGFNHAEIASHLDIAESSSRTFLLRARKKMQELINNQEITSTNGQQSA